MVTGWMMTAEMSAATTNIRLFCGRDSDGMVRKLEDAMIHKKIVSSLEIRETFLEDSVIDSIVDLLSRGSVKTIHLEDCSAHLNKSAVRLVEALGNCRDVRLSEHTFLSKYFLATFLESATQLKKLWIKDHLLVEQVESLSRGLVSNKNLHTLDLSRSKIDDFPLLAEGLRDGCAKKVKLRSIGLRDGQLATLMGALGSSPPPPPPPSSPTSPPPSPNEANNSLESLDLSFNRLRNLECIGGFLKRPDCRLKELLVGYQNLWQPNRNGTNIVVSAIAGALSHNTRLTTLKLPRNELSDEDAILFAVALSDNSTLETLDLRENNLRDDSVVALAEAARWSRGLHQLHLRGNPFGTRASQALLEAAANNFHLSFVGDNGRDVDEETTINQEIRYHTALNRGGRKLLLEVTPHLALWPLVLEKQTSRPNWEDYPPGSDMRNDVLFYLLKEGSMTLFSSQTTN